MEILSICSLEICWNLLDFPAPWSPCFFQKNSFENTIIKCHGCRRWPGKNMKKNTRISHSILKCQQFSRKLSCRNIIQYEYPDAPCMEYLPTFTTKITQIKANYHTWSIWGINITFFCRSHMVSGSHVAMMKSCSTMKAVFLACKMNLVEHEPLAATGHDWTNGGE